MKKLCFLSIAVIALCFCIEANGQLPPCVPGGGCLYGGSITTINTATQRVEGEAISYLNYQAGIYYNPAVEAWLFRTDIPTVDLDYRYNQGSSSERAALVFLSTNNYVAGRTYCTYSRHYIVLRSNGQHTFGGDYQDCKTVPSPPPTPTPSPTPCDPLGLNPCFPTPTPTPTPTSTPRATIAPFDAVGKYGTIDVGVTITNSNGVNTIVSFRNSSGIATFADGTAAKAYAGNQNLTLKIRGVFESSQLDGVFLEVTNNNVLLASEPFTVATVDFQKEAICTGFDDIEMPPFLMVPQNGTNRMKAKLFPNGVNARFNLETPAGITAVPSTITSGEPLITVSGGGTIGQFELRAMANEATQPASILKTTVRRRIEKSVVIHAVTEDNDDVQNIPVGQGEPSKIAIEPLETRLASTPSGDDQLVLANLGLGRNVYVITTGPDGIRQSALSGDDIERIPIGQGFPNSYCVMVGSNRASDTNPSGDDVRDGSGNITSGADGICQTTAYNTDIVPNESSIPSAVSLQEYLNNTAWGKQANIFFTVTRDTVNHDVHFDLDRDRKFNGVRAQRVNEYFRIEEVARDPVADMDLYYTGTGFAMGGDVDDANAEAVPAGNGFGSVFFSPDHTGGIDYLAAHEIGHILMPDVNVNTVHSTSVLDLMYSRDLLASPCRIRKRDWDLLISQ